VRIGSIGAPANPLTIDSGDAPLTAQLAVKGATGILSALAYTGNEIHIGFDTDYDSRQAFLRDAAHEIV